MCGLGCIGRSALRRPDDNLLSPAAIADPLSFFRRLRDYDPVVWSERHNVWIVTAHADVQRLFQDQTLSSARMISGFRQRVQAQHGSLVKHAMGLLDGWMLLNDPPAHGRLRDPVRKAFAPSVVAQLAPRIETHTHALLDELDPDCDLVADFCRPLTSLVICELLGVDPRERDFLSEWSRAFGRLIYGTSSRDTDYVKTAAAMADQFYERFAKHLAVRRSEPCDDLLSHLLQASVSESWTENELVGACSMLLFAGHDTTSALIASSVRALLQHPDQMPLMRAERTTVGVAVEELLRFDGPSKTNIRVAQAPFELGGHEVEEGQHIWLGVMAANHDPEVFDQPQTLNLQRQPNPHLAFGAGIHFCLGPSLARLEATIALPALLERFPEMRLVSPDKLQYSPTVVDRSLLELPLRLV